MLVGVFVVRRTRSVEYAVVTFCTVFSHRNASEAWPKKRPSVKKSSLYLSEEGVALTYFTTRVRRVPEPEAKQKISTPSTVISSQVQDSVSWKANTVHVFVLCFLIGRNGRREEARKFSSEVTDARGCSQRDDNKDLTFAQTPEAGQNGWPARHWESRAVATHPFTY